MKKSLFAFIAVFSAVVFSGCYSTDPVAISQTPEDSIVFTRPKRFAPAFGSYSLNEYVEVTYNRSYRNNAGLLVVEVGIRNRGPVSWTNWFVTAPENIYLTTRCTFFNGVRNGSAPVYHTNQSNIAIGRGKTYHFKAICPDASATDYQLVLGD